MENPVTLLGVTGVRVFTTPDTGNGTGVNVEFIGTPFTLTVNTPLANGAPPVSYGVVFKGA